MKVSKWILVAGISAVAVVAGRAWAFTTEVFKVKATLEGSVEYVEITNTVSKVKTNGVTIYVTNEVINAEIISVVMNSDDIVNLAMGRNLGTKLPNNEVLGVTTRCGENVLQWVVYDKEAERIAALIGDFSPQVRGVGRKKNKEQIEDSAVLTIQRTGSDTNAFLEGILSASIESEVNTNGCMKTSKITMIGWLNTIIAATYNQTASNPVSLQPVMIRKATLKTQDKNAVGTVITPEP